MRDMSSNRDINVVSSSKNTRRRIQQKRTRNKNGGGGGGDLKKNEDKPNPVIESSNPFFIAVCSPESYKPNNNNNNNRMGGGGGGGGRRHNESAHNSIRTKPNVFLRQPSRNSSYETSGGGASSHPNQFIHHPRLQNDRQSVPITVARPVAVSRPVAVTTNIHDIEQFPTLSSGSTVLNTTKLNFKEMVLKNTIAAAVAVAATISPVEVMPVAPQKYYSPVVSQKTLSSGNIFLSAFYGSSGGDGDDGGCDGGCDGDGDGGGGYDSFGGGGGVSSLSSSVLVDSCDRKYDNLYKY